MLKRTQIYIVQIQVPECMHTQRMRLHHIHDVLQLRTLHMYYIHTNWLLHPK